MALTEIRVRGAREHNLKGVDLDLPRDQMIVVTGLSGSGKSTLAFDTIYAEGQRKYMESLSAYARQFLDQMQKPDVESIEGLPPTIAIEQRSASHNPRSTVATTTEIYDYLRLLFARAGRPRCWHVETEGKHKGKRCGHPIAAQSATQIVDAAFAMPEGTKLMILAPVVRGKKGHHREVFEGMGKQGFVRARVDGEVKDLREIATSKAGTPFTTKTQRYQRHTVDAVVDRVVVKAVAPEANGDADGLRARVADSIELALKIADGLVVLSHQAEDGSWVDTLYSEKYACPIHPECSLEDLEPRLFSFNSPYGACPTCAGLGTKQEFDPELVIGNDELSLSENAIEPWRETGTMMKRYYNRVIRRFCKDFGVAADTPIGLFPSRVRQVLLHGTTSADESHFGAHFEGVLPNLQRRFETTESEWVKQRLAPYLTSTPCPTCHGARLREEALHVFIETDQDLGPGLGIDRDAFANPGDLAKDVKLFNINDVTGLTIEQAAAFFDRLKLSREEAQIAAPILKEVRARLGFMLSVGLGYLNLSRSTGSLSGGEAQRIRLATQVGSGLVGCCYVLDEPTIGLHQRDNDRLIRTLRHLCDIGNTVVVVEHDEDTIRAADWLLDIGPGPGAHGGQVVVSAPLAEAVADPDSLTVKFLTGERQIPVPEYRREVNEDYALRLTGCSANNLKGVDVAFPLGGLTVVTGVSGSGKSTLVNQTLLPALKRAVIGSRVKPGEHATLDGADQLERIIEVDQSPIGRTPRSNPATYTGVFDSIRTLFSRTKEANIRGYKPGRFSFNVKGGRCESCQGQGVKKIEMHFLPDVFVECDVCHGSRYNRETLEVTYRGKNIAEVLSMTVEEGLDFFDAHPDIKRMLTAINDVGLSYIELGQASTTLSGGEAQRVKLATELGKRPASHTLYVLDEPTTGLHFADVEKLIGVLQHLADEGHSVIVIEHNLDVIKVADWLIDLGPEGGDRGGTIVAAGPPEHVAEVKGSYTGRYLRDHLPALLEV
ncbi:MAG: excinuclease ABC subunit UvrA [Planctomycetota bacterium]